MEATTAKLLEIGCEVEEFDDAVRVVASKPLHHTQVTTLPYPGFPTDMQPQMAVVLGISEGTSTVTESIFENRFKYVDELTRMGANIKVESNIAIINGTEKYTGARVNAPDLRAGAALVIAGLAAEGITVVDDIYYIESSNRKVTLYLRHEKIEYYDKISSLESELKPDFFRIHKGYLVNIKYVERYDRTEVKMRNGDSLLISKYKYQDFVKRYLEYILEER